MHLTLAEVARLFSVAEKTVTHWIRQYNLPARGTNSLPEFDRDEVLHWTAANKAVVSPGFLGEPAEDDAASFNLADALERGGVATHVLGEDRYEVFRNAITGLSTSLGLDQAALLDQLTGREKSGGAAVGGGVAIPHPRYPVVIPNSPAILRVGYLARPLRWEAADRKPVHTLFIMICPTVREHERLLSRLERLVEDEAFRTILATHPDQSMLTSIVRTVETSPSYNSGVP